MLIHLSGIDCAPDQHGKFNRWYDGTHIPMLPRFDEMRKVERFARLGNDAAYPHYLTLYHFDSADAFQRHQQSRAPAEGLEETRATWAGKGYYRQWRVQY